MMHNSCGTTAVAVRCSQAPFTSRCPRLLKAWRFCEHRSIFLKAHGIRKTFTFYVYPYGASMARASRDLRKVDRRIVPVAPVHPLDEQPTWCRQATAADPVLPIPARTSAGCFKMPFRPRAVFGWLPVVACLLDSALIFRGSAL